MTKLHWQHKVHNSVQYNTNAKWAIGQWREREIQKKNKKTNENLCEKWFSGDLCKMRYAFFG